MIITAEIIAQKYAVAFCNLYGAGISEEKLSRLKAFALFLNKQKSFFLYLAIPTIAASTKLQIIERLLTHFTLNHEIKLLMLTLLKHKRIDLLDLIIKRIVKQQLKHRSISLFSVYTSHALQDEEKQRIISFIKHEKPQKTIKAEFFIMPELISGIRIKSDTFLWERSMSRLLRETKKNMLQQVGV